MYSVQQDLMRLHLSHITSASNINQLKSETWCHHFFHINLSKSGFNIYWKCKIVHIKLKKHQSEKIANLIFVKDMVFSYFG